MKTLLVLLKELQNKITNSETLHSTVSKSSVGWHIEHALLTIKQIIDALEKSKPQNYKWKFNLIRIYIYSRNRIPRGKGKAPKSVQPAGIIIVPDLQNKIEDIRLKVNNLSNLNANNYFEHPYFGKLNLKPAMKFLEIHTRHHLLIINDIIKADKAST